MQLLSEEEEEKEDLPSPISDELLDKREASLGEDESANTLAQLCDKAVSQEATTSDLHSSLSLLETTLKGCLLGLVLASSLTLRALLQSEFVLKQLKNEHKSVLKEKMREQ